MRVLTIAAAGALLLGATPPDFRAVERIEINDNRLNAGQLRNGVLTVRLEVRMGDWRPDHDEDAGLEVAAFAEEGRPLQIPGPLLRVREGTTIRITVRNTLTEDPLIVHGLYTRGRASEPDTIHVAPGRVRELRFLAGTPGTYYYWASIGESRVNLVRPGVASQLSGALVIDKRDSPVVVDRIFVLGFWADSALELVGDARRRMRFVINGKSWPRTERLTYTQGEPIHWRVINTNAQVHPMHLHGFYFTVNSRGNEHTDSIYDPDSAPHLAVTERLAPGRTMSMTWVPERAGNWLYHCHDNVHITPQLPLSDAMAMKSSVAPHEMNHALQMMAGLVMAVQVKPGRRAERESAPAEPRRLRLIARADPGGSSAEPAYGFIYDEPGKLRTSGPALIPSPTLYLKRGEPVSITIVNELNEPTAIHWHGIELDSYFDGVAGMSGRPGNITPAIAPRDSFEARFTPPRSGTFIYHTHIDELRQQRAGLAGALLVLDDPGRFDPRKNVVIMVSTPRGSADRASVLVNGSTKPRPIDLRVGIRNRFRIINIHTYRPSMFVKLEQGTELLSWRAVAKDGAELPPERATVRPAVLQFGNGETYDFEFEPTVPGELTITVTAANGAVLATVPVRVR